MSLIGFSGPGGGASVDLFDRLRREFDGLFERAAVAAPTAAPGVMPALNLYETDDGYVLTAELPGLRHEDLEVQVEGRRVTLRGERRVEVPAGAGTSLHRRERRSGGFRRTIELPTPIDAAKVQAIYRHGVLTLRLPKEESHRPRRIEVRMS